MSEHRYQASSVKRQASSIKHPAPSIKLSTDGDGFAAGYVLYVPNRCVEIGHRATAQTTFAPRARTRNRPWASVSHGTRPPRIWRAWFCSARARYALQTPLSAAERWNLIYMVMVSHVKHLLGVVQQSA